MKPGGDAMVLEQARCVFMSALLPSRLPSLAAALRELPGVDVLESPSETLAMVHDDTVHLRATIGDVRFAIAPRAHPHEVALPVAPGDGRGRLSTWMRPVPGGALVPELMQSGFDVIGLQHEVGLGRLIQTFFDVETTRLQARGVRVTRIPMLPPTDLVRDVQRPESWIAEYTSPTESVLVTHAGGMTAFLPCRALERFPARYGAAAVDIQRAQSRVFEDLGIATKFVQVDSILDEGGLPSLLTGTGVYRDDVRASA